MKRHRKLISHMLIKTEQNAISEEIVRYFESPEKFKINLVDELKLATISAYKEILLVQLHKNNERKSPIYIDLIVTLDEIKEMIEKVDVQKENLEKFYSILDLLALALACDDQTDEYEGNSIESLNFFGKRDEKSFYISNLMLISFIDAGFIHDKEQPFVRDIIERLSSTIKEECKTMSKIYCIAIETLKLLFDEKIMNPLKFLARILKPLRKSDIESFAIILCDFIEYLPNKKLGLCQAMNMLNELDLFLLLEKSARKVKNPEIDTKRCFFLLKNCVELFRELNLPYKSELMSWDPEKSREYVDAWDKFFTIVESLKENMKHLILPAFGLLEQLDILGPRWKICLLERGFQNDNATVQTFCASYLLKSKDLWTEIGNGSESTFTEVINSTILFSNFKDKDVNFDLELYSEFVQTNPDFVQLEQLQKSVPIYFTVKALFGLIRSYEKSEKDKVLEYLNQILATLAMVHNTLIRAEIIDEVLKFIFLDKKWYELLLELNLVYLLEPNEGTNDILLNDFFEVPWNTLTKIYESPTPVSLKMKFISKDLILEDQNASPLIFVHAFSKYCLKSSTDQAHSTQLKLKCEKILTNFIETITSEQHSTKITELISAIEHLILTCHQIFITQIQNLTQVSVLKLTNPSTSIQIKAIVAQILKCLSQNQDLLNSGSIRTSLEFLTDSMQLLCKTNSSQSKNKGDGELFSKYYQAMSVVRSNVYLRCSAEKANILDELEFSLHLMDVGGSRILTSEMKTLKVLFNQHLTSDLPEDSEILNESFSIIERCYTEMMSYRRFDYFWDCLENFIEMILASNHNLFEEMIVPQYYAKFMKMADVTQGIAYIILSKLFQLRVETIRRISSYKEILVWGLLFGEQFNRNKRTETEICMEIHGKKPYLNTRYQYKESADVRALSNAMLMKMCDSENRNSEEIRELFKTLLDKYREISDKHSRCYADSQTHLDKLRICQSLLVFPVSSLHHERKFIEDVQKATFFDSNLPNVSYLLEVLFTSMVSDQYLEQLISNEDFIMELRPSGSESLFVILFYSCCSEKTKPHEFLEKVITKLLPFAMGQHFTTRLYAQTVLRKLIQRRFYQKGLDLRLNLVKEGLDRSFELMGDTKNLRSFNDIRFLITNHSGIFDIETIFCHIPTVTDLCPAEIITCDMFNKAFELINYNKKLSPLHSEFTQKIKTQMQQITTSDLESPELISTTNVQTKIIPAKQMLPSNHLSDIYPVKYMQNKTEHSDLIVIATLLTKQPNLGGLARTCEIFNIDQYIVGSLQQTEMMAFQSLSMSADKWLKMAEVKPNDLLEYLKILKMKGYVVVGAEQTANSGQITEFKFPKKTALLLGNEKEGIPGNFISMLDYAVEIPQFGVCRSLNVHVCGSIFIWEYAKQHQVK
uniref:CSON008651 protein n=1 Tax=Culicoides sonorensis TaxID=179676 RepID=A0A336LZ75_CULSO